MIRFRNVRLECINSKVKIKDGLVEKKIGSIKNIDDKTSNDKNKTETEKCIKRGRWREITAKIKITKN